MVILQVSGANPGSCCRPRGAADLTTRRSSSPTHPFGWLPWARAPARRARRPRSGTRRLGGRRGSASQPDARRRKRRASRQARSARRCRSGRDVWGERLLAAPDGPTLAGARQYLGPLVLARAAGRTSLTDSGVAYLPFGVPLGARGAADGVALHLVDGSEIVARRVGGPALRVSVGATGGEATAPAAGGWPRRGSRTAGCRSSRRATSTAQASATARSRSPPAAAGLTSYVRLTADSERRPRRRARGRALPRRVDLGAGSRELAHLRRLVAARRRSAPGSRDAAAYDAARASLVRYWQKRLAEGMRSTCPSGAVTGRGARAARAGPGARPGATPSATRTRSSRSPRASTSRRCSASRASRTSRARSCARRSRGRPRRTRTGRWARSCSASARALPALPRPRYLDARDARPRAATSPRSAARSREPDRPARARALLVRHPRPGLRAALAGGRVGRGCAGWPTRGRRPATPRSPRDAARWPRASGRPARAVRASQRRLPDGSLFIPIRLLDDEAPTPR